MAQQPRALVLAEDDRIVVIKRLARAVLKFQDNFLDRESSPAGLLCQASSTLVWLPEVTGENEVVLKTKGMPFCVAGLGDLLALFRCISCRFAFGTDVKKVSQLGAPGRVFTSSEPELTCNVQKYSKTAYLRKAEAEQCQVQSTLLLPVFLSSQRHGCVGVLEVVQTSEDMRFMEVAALIANVLEKCQLYTCPQSSIERQLSRATTVATVLLPPSVDILRPAQGGSEGSNGRANSTDGVPMADEGVLEQAALGGSTGQVASEGGLPAGAAAAGSDDEGYDDDDLESGDEGDEGVAEAGGGARPSRSGARSTGTAGDRPSRRRGKGSGNPGKPGVRLSLEDLQSQFGVGLKEAAARLGICPTTLKRACRQAEGGAGAGTRHGIQRWPRRQLMKVNQALDQMEAQAPLGALAQQAQQSQHMRKPMQQLGGGLGGLPAPDTRWTALAQFIPAFQQTLQYNDNLLGFGPGQGGQLGLPGLHQEQGDARPRQGSGSGALSHWVFVGGVAPVIVHGLLHTSVGIGGRKEAERQLHGR
uniref:Nitrate assimilation regulatory protein n=1 Tax=Parachlorella kessleri TaxID=3074 RepID=A0A292GBD5_PARKE|nr:nitrate assimilation regulatory protein [Parachlorella kessleri]